VNARSLIVTVLAGVVAALAVLALVSVDHMSDGQTVEGCLWDGADWVYDDDTPMSRNRADATVDSQGLPACVNHRLAVLGAGGRVT
jgi:hypothetical protein